MCNRFEYTRYIFAHIQMCFPFQKLYVFLFQDILVLTRPVTRNERQAYQVYRQPIPVQELLLEDLQDGDVKMGGSFRGAFGNSDKGREQTSSSAWESLGEERLHLGVDLCGLRFLEESRHVICVNIHL